MSHHSGLVALCYLVVFGCIWSLIACMGGEYSRHTFRDAFIAFFIMSAMLVILTLEAYYG